MDVVSRHATVIDVLNADGRPISVTSCAKGRRYEIQRDDLLDGKISISFAATDGTLYTAEAGTRPNLRTRRRGWEVLPTAARRPHAASREKGGEESSIDSLVWCYRLYAQDRRAERSTVVLVASPDPADFLAHLPDEASLAELALPGTHESCALYGFPISQCQQPSTPIARQLLDGVRFFDIRLRIVGDQLLVYHGPRPERTDLATLLSTFHAFLLSHPSETLIVSVKEEGPPFHPVFSKMAWEGFRPHLPRFWYTQERVPTLGEVRGRAVLLARFDRVGARGVGEWPSGLGIHPDRWPDSRREGFEWTCADRIMRVQDWYRVPSFLHIPEKLDTIARHLEATLTARPVPAASDADTPLTLDYASAAGTALSLPTTMAKGFGWPNWGLGVEGINARLVRWLLRMYVEGRRVRGVVALDFYRQAGAAGGALPQLLVAMNFLD